MTEQQLNNIINAPMLKYQKEGKFNREMCSMDIDIRLQKFIERFVSEDTPKEDRPTKDIIYFTSDMQDVVNELVSHIPYEYSTTGKESEFVKKVLIQYSFLKRVLPSAFFEIVLSTKAIIIPTPIVTMKEGIKISYNLKVPRSEDCIINTNIVTGKLESVYVKEKKEFYNESENITKEGYLISKFDLEGMTTNVVDMSGVTIDGYKEEFFPNPYKHLGIMQCLLIEGFKDTNGLPYASRLRELQLQIDNKNSNIDNIINLHGSPLYIIKNAIQDWSNGVPMGAGKMVVLRGEEDLKSETPKAQLNDIQMTLDRLVDKIYKNGGLVPIKLRDKMFSTDSSKVTKLAQSETISQVKHLLENAREALDKLVLMCLSDNGKEYTNESFQVPLEVMPIDLDSTMNTMAIAMNLQIVDPEWIYDNYFSDMEIEEKERIKLYWEKQNAVNYAKESKIGITNTNVTNLAKKANKTKPASNSSANKKETSQDAKEEGVTAVV